jgi:hypothetical protein
MTDNICNWDMLELLQVDLYLFLKTEFTQKNTKYY